MPNKPNSYSSHTNFKPQQKKNKLTPEPLSPANTQIDLSSTSNNLILPKTSASHRDSYTGPKLRSSTPQTPKTMPAQRTSSKPYLNMDSYFCAMPGRSSRNQRKKKGVEPVPFSNPKTDSSFSYTTLRYTPSTASQGATYTGPTLRSSTRKTLEMNRTLQPSEMPISHLDFDYSTKPGTSSKKSKKKGVKLVPFSSPKTDSPYTSNTNLYKTPTSSARKALRTNPTRRSSDIPIAYLNSYYNAKAGSSVCKKRKKKLVERVPFSNPKTESPTSSSVSRKTPSSSALQERSYTGPVLRSSTRRTLEMNSAQQLLNTPISHLDSTHSITTWSTNVHKKKKGRVEPIVHAVQKNDTPSKSNTLFTSARSCTTKTSKTSFESSASSMSHVDACATSGPSRNVLRARWVSSGLESSNIDSYTQLQSEAQSLSTDVVSSTAAVVISPLSLPCPTSPTPAMPAYTPTVEAQRRSDPVSEVDAVEALPELPGSSPSRLVSHEVYLYTLADVNSIYGEPLSDMEDVLPSDDILSDNLYDLGSFSPSYFDNFDEQEVDALLRNCPDIDQQMQQDTDSDVEVD